MGEVLLPCCLNYGLKVTPWFFTKVQQPVIARITTLVYSVYAYLDNSFRSPRLSRHHTPLPRMFTVANSDLQALQRLESLDV